MNQTNSGLLRFRSAPSTLFSNLPNAGGDKSGDLIEGFRDSSSHEVLGLTSNELISNRVGEFGSENKFFITKNHSLNSQLPPHYPRQSNLDCNFQAQPKMGSTLMRQSSSPAGLFSQNGYATIRGVGNFGSGGDLNVSSNILKRQVSFSPGIVPSTLGMLTRIAEVDGENIEDSCPDDAKIGNGSGPTQFYSSEIPSFGSWNNSLHFGESFSGLKRELEDDGKLYTASQSGEMPILSHHLSLPQTSAEMEKLLQFQDSVPCKIRAKRGCATHPRSIAERVRRTRISERMRKLQELVPYMDKQTNTADMLDLAVDYIKDLQKQFKSLSDNRANCRCSNMHKTM